MQTTLAVLLGIIAAALYVAIFTLPVWAGCVATQTCQTCYRADGSAYQCNCQMQCLPGTH